MIGSASDSLQQHTKVWWFCNVVVKRLLAERADADFFEPHDINWTVILQADIANLRSLVLTFRFPVLFPFWKIRGLGIERANVFAIDIDVDEISFQGYHHCPPAGSGERRQLFGVGERIDGTCAMLFVADFADLHFKTAMDRIPRAEFLFRFVLLFILALLLPHLLIFSDFQDAVVNANKDASVGPRLFAPKDNSNLAGAKGFLRIQRVQFDFTCVKGVDYTVFFAVWDSSSDLLFMGWGVQAHPVRLVDFLF